MNVDKSKITIKTMDLNDLNQIADCLENKFDDFWTYDILKNDLNSNISIYLVAKINEQIIGFAGFKIILDEAELMNIVVRKDLRNYGIGSLLMEHIITELKNKKITTLHLEVAKNNKSAILLYKKFGFIQSRPS